MFVFIYTRVTCHVARGAWHGITQLRGSVGRGLVGSPVSGGAGRAEGGAAPFHVARGRGQLAGAGRARGEPGAGRALGGGAGRGEAGGGEAGLLRDILRQVVIEKHS